jgi:hypothetical protein
MQPDRRRVAWHGAVFVALLTAAAAQLIGAELLLGDGVCLC